MNAVKVGSRSQLWPLDEKSERDNSVARYNRVAIVETVLAIRERRQRASMIIAATGFILLGVGVLAAGVLGWL